MLKSKQSCQSVSRKKSHQICDLSLTQVRVVSCHESAPLVVIDEGGTDLANIVVVGVVLRGHQQQDESLCELDPIQ